MYAVVGTLFLATAAVVSAWTYAQFRRVNRSRWTERELPVVAITLVELTLLIAGLELFGRYLADVAARPFGWAEAAMSAVYAATLLLAIALLRVSWRVRRRRRRLPPTRSLPRRSEPRDALAHLSPRRRRDGEPVRSHRSAADKHPAKREAA